LRRVARGALVDVQHRWHAAASEGSLDEIQAIDTLHLAGRCESRERPAATGAPISDTMACFLVTGSAGFIGAKVSLLLLEAGHDVVGLDNLNTAYDPCPIAVPTSG
jgi:NAD dependent epimerase/dehydratase family